MKFCNTSLNQLVPISLKTIFGTNFRTSTISSLHTSSVSKGVERKIAINYMGGLQTKSSAGRFSNSKQGTVVHTEVEKFNDLADNWWDLNGDCKPLHSMNKLRVQLIRNGLLHAKQILDENVNGPFMLKGLKILDVGCGGGILSEPLSRLGGKVIGIDAAERNIEVAQSHAQNNSDIFNGLRYFVSTIEEHSEKSVELYDAVIVSDVLEHVDNVSIFMEKCISCLKPGGSLFVTTINRTTKSYIAGIILAEKILNLLPDGTHNWDRFIPLDDLKQMIGQEGCSVRLVHGMLYIPVRNEWFWVSDSSVNYAVHAIKL